MVGIRRSASGIASAIACSALLAALWAAPAGAATNSPAACVNLAHQLVHYDTMRERAADADNGMWLARIDQQIDALESQLSSRCPDEARRVRNDQQLAELLRLAAQGAITFFTMGAY